MKKKKKKEDRPTKFWSYAQATQILPYIHPLLEELRTSYILVWHLFKKNKYNVEEGKYHQQVVDLRARGAEILGELKKLHILPYWSPLRGIALFQFVIQYEDGQGGALPRDAYFVYKDSRETIDSYIFDDEFTAYCDLYAWETPVPEPWKTRGSRIVVSKNRP